ncbi:MAG: DUF4919 domain-containing protein [Anaerolineae bacterium]|nr:DUF4919 domain-containing protein [Anaerolineae bacterium]MEB2287121.1 DUF4919 domain-containing protein [Anaerolineae bacterium]
MDYDELLAAAQASPAGADFHTLRMAYARSGAYAPYTFNRASVQMLHQALTARDLDAALEAAHDLLSANYLDIEAHMVADYVHTLRGSGEQAAYHRAFAQGLIGAILATGDGRSQDTAFIVLSTAEEYTVLRLLGYQSTMQRLVREDNHAYDVLHGRHTKTGQEVDFYFNIDLPFGWLQHQSFLSGAPPHDEPDGSGETP